MAIHLHRAHRTDVLAAELGQLLATPLTDPFAQEVVVVPARGVERWLTQRLSHHLGVTPGRSDGVCAGVRFHSPHSLVSLLTGTERTDPWHPNRLAWPLLETIDSCADQAWAQVLATHLGAHDQDDSLRRDRRYRVARRLAGLFAGYATQRPGMLARWRAGEDSDGEQPLDSDLCWQPELYRRLLERIPGPAPDQRHADVLTQIRGGQPLALPDRLSLFGHTRLPVTEVELLAAVGQVREVHLWLPQTSAALWEALAQVVAPGTVARADDVSADTVAHPLLASLGRDARELQRSLTGLRADTDTAAADHARPGQAPSTLLGCLQHDLRANAEPAPDVRNRRQPSVQDRSLQVHSCHGPARQVEVLRDVLLGLLQEDPTLAPRDILVMCPDIDSYAPLFESAFGLADLDSPDDADPHPGHGLRVRLADRGPGHTNPLLDIASRVVAIAGGRASASDVLGLASTDVVSRRFRFSQDDLAQLSQWVQHANIRWGLAADLREPYALEQLPHNTWQLGLDRILLGVAMSEDGQRRFAHTLPLDDVPSAAVDLAGRFAELIQRLETSVRALHAARAADEWIAALRQAIDGLGEPEPRQAWQQVQADRELAQIADAAAGLQVPLRLADIRALLESRMSGRAGRANFRTGALTISTMVPMRSVPHKVIALVGLDDGHFPRMVTVDGDDVLARRPRTGERDLRAEDRQLLLDAVMATTQTLVITYTGREEIRGEPRPPAVPLSELLDAADITMAEPVRDQVHVQHPLQPFDARNFTPGALGHSGPFSFDTASLTGAQAARGPRTIAEPFLVQPLLSRPITDLGLADLHQMLAHPVRTFVRRRLDISLPWDEPEPADAIPVELDNLEQWAIGDRMLRQVLRGQSLAEAEAAERASGAVPPLALGSRVLNTVRSQVEPLAALAATMGIGTGDSLDITIDLDDRRLTGQVPDVHGERLVRMSFSKLGPKARLAAWIDLVALTVARPQVAWTAHVIGRDGRESPARRSILGPIQPQEARTVLTALIDIYDRGMDEPLPMPLKTAAAWAQATGVDERRAYRAASAWTGGRFDGEQDDQYHRLVWGAQLPFQPDPTVPVGQQRGLLADHPRDGEYWNTQTTRLGQYALRLWEPLLRHEKQESV